METPHLFIKMTKAQRSPLKTFLIGRELDPRKEKLKANMVSTKSKTQGCYGDGARERLHPVSFSGQPHPLL